MEKSEFLSGFWKSKGWDSKKKKVKGWDSRTTTGGRSNEQESTGNLGEDGPHS